MRPFHPGPVRSPLAPAVLALIGWTLILLLPAAAQMGPLRPCGPPPCRALPPQARPVSPYGPPPVIVQGYLPRNHALPIYNEPPARAPAY